MRKSHAAAYVSFLSMKGPLMSTWDDIHGRFEAEKADAIRAMLDHCDALAELGVARLIVSYEGTGDSGETQNAVAFNAQDQEVVLPNALAEELAALADNLIPYGYEIDDGGQGNIMLNVAARQIQHEHSDFYVESETTTTTYDRELLDQAELAGDQAPESL
jgi:hypothetical protein